ncbi:MAG: aminotransferase class I/II-fold pyridoxal phosphate-dependent enzyme [Muribaculaceae bacterium]|nr:aminotransferase class I/II-fold pyridoxal phosphate-dependent enzyme [Muribaculaceae bacterium]
MKQTIEDILQTLTSAGNFRVIPSDASRAGRVDLSSNDYLGISERQDLRDEFFSSTNVAELVMSASASRLLARRQNCFTKLEDTIAVAYGCDRSALIFNSGYHANVGLISAFASTGLYVLADKLVHASIIDGIKLSGLPFARFRHNDISHLDALARKASADGKALLIIAESVYSMDGDKADVEGLIEVKRRYAGSMLYIDEAHAVGVEGPCGLGLSKASRGFDDVDIVVGTFGKALASVGAYAVLKPHVRDFMVNKARSLIFSTALPPINVEWSRFIFNRALEMDAERLRLKKLGLSLAAELQTLGVEVHASHILPLVVGDPAGAVELSSKLRDSGYDVLPVRVPTVPPGTDRLRFSLSAALPFDAISSLGYTLRSIYGK